MFVANALIDWVPESWTTDWSGDAGNVKLGASFTPVTVMVNVLVALVSTPPFAVPPLSVRWTLTSADPLALSAGVKVRLPVVSSTEGWTENRAVLSLVAWNVSVCPDSSAGPVDIADARPGSDCAPASSSTVWSGDAGSVKLGASLTPVTVMVNVLVGLVSTPLFAVPPLSVRCTLTTAEPFALDAGVKVRFPVVSLTDGCTENRPVLSFAAWKVNAWPASSAGPADIADVK